MCVQCTLYIGFIGLFYYFCNVCPNRTSRSWLKKAEKEFYLTKSRVFTLTVLMETFIGQMIQFLDMHMQFIIRIDKNHTQEVSFISIFNSFSLLSSYDGKTKHCSVSAIVEFNTLHFQSKSVNTQLRVIMGEWGVNLVLIFIMAEWGVNLVR